MGWVLHIENEVMSTTSCGRNFSIIIPQNNKCLILQNRYQRGMDLISTSTPHDLINFFKLYDPLASRPLRLGVRGYSDDLTRDQVRSLFRGNLRFNYPLKLGAYSGGHATDIIWSGFTWLVCVSDRIVNLLQANGVTGWSTFPVELFGRKGEPIPAYHGFSVNGPEYKRDRSRSTIITKQAVPGGKPYQVYKGLYFEEKRWDGSDFFIVFNQIIVTNKIHDIFKKNKISNVLFTPLSEVEIDVYFDMFENN